MLDPVAWMYPRRSLCFPVAIIFEIHYYHVVYNSVMYMTLNVVYNDDKCW